MFAFGAPSAPVANWCVLGFPEASSSYNFIYSRFPSTPGSGPSSPSRARLSSPLQLGVLLVGRGFRDRYPAPPLAAAQMGSGSESPGPRRRRQHRLTQADLSGVIRADVAARRVSTMLSCSPTVRICTDGVNKLKSGAQRKGRH